MPTQVTNYQCPSCTGPLHYSSESGKLECEFCGSSYDVAEIEALYAEKNQKAEQASAAEQKKEEQKAEKVSKTRGKFVKVTKGREADSHGPVCGRKVGKETQTYF